MQYYIERQAINEYSYYNMPQMDFGFLSKKAINNTLQISGIASSNAVDRQGEAINILPSALKKAVPIFLSKKSSSVKAQAFLPNGKAINKTFNMPNNGTVLYHHGGVDNDGNYFGKKQVGTVTRLEPLDTSIEDKKTLDEIISSSTPAKPYQIRADVTVTDPNVIKLINDGVAKQFSLNWYPCVRVQNRLTGEYFDVSIAIMELSITPNPVNTDAKFEVVDDSDYKYNIGDSIDTKDDVYEVIGQVKGIDSKEPYYKVRSQMVAKAVDLIMPESAFETKSYSVSFDRSIKAEVKDSDKELIDEVFKKYHSTVNMGYSQLLAWSKTKDSKMASLTRAPVYRNLQLLQKAKTDWNKSDVTKANKTIAFVGRMKNAEQGKPANSSTKYSKRDISLMNWAYKP